VVPAREGLRLKAQFSPVYPQVIGEVVPAREGLRPRSELNSGWFFAEIGEVVPAREGLRQRLWLAHGLSSEISEKWFQQEKD